MEYYAQKISTLYFWQGAQSMKHTSQDRTRKFFTLLFSIVLIGSPMVVQSAVAADYPPSVETLEVGKPVITPIPPRKQDEDVVVPKATSTDIPLIVGDPKPKETLKGKVLSNKSVEKSPVKLSPSLTIGGIGADEKAPTATFNKSKKTEIQVPTDVPTRITVTGFTPGAKGTASFIDSSNRSIPLGSVQANGDGKVFIPALTFSKGNVSYTIKLVFGGKTTTFTVRSSG